MDEVVPVPTESVVETVSVITADPQQLEALAAAADEAEVAPVAVEGDVAAQNAVAAVVGGGGPTALKAEADDGSAGERLNALINIVSEVDTDTILQVVSPKLLDHFSIWDFMLQKAKINSTVGTGAMETILNDVNAILGELKLLVESCLRPVRMGKAQMELKRKRQVFSDFVKIDSMLSLAICIDSDANIVWKKRDPEDIVYSNPLLDPDLLFPATLEPLDEEFASSIKAEAHEDESESKHRVDDDDDDDDIAEEPDDGEIMNRDEDPDFRPLPRKRKIKPKRDPDMVPTFGFGKRKRKSGPKVAPKVKKEKNVEKKEGEEDVEGKTEEDVKPPKKPKGRPKGRPKAPEEKERYLCLKCGQTVAMSHGKKHEARCTGMHVRHPEYKKINEEYWCTVEGCTLGYGFNSVYGLRKHFHGVHVREEEKYFACDYCDERFSFLTTKNKHMKMKHIKPHICDICGKGFGFRNKLADHRLIHTGEKPYACDKCEYRASKKGNLDAHKIDKHSDFGGNKNYICGMCQKQFTTMGRVRRHMETMHAEGKEESARVRRQRAKLAQQAAVQGLIGVHDGATIKFKEQRDAEEAARPAVVHMIPVQVGEDVVTATGQQEVIHHVQQDEQDAAVQFLETDLSTYQQLANE